MTTHVFIVNDTTFKYHLEYMFAGTGSKDKVIDFNNKEISNLHHSSESSLVGMMADGCRIRKDDLVIFYLQATSIHEGMFFGVFQAISEGIFLDNFENNGNKQYLYNELGKSLTFRVQIKPYEVYPLGVTEWMALDEIKDTCSPYQMQWSLIYRKLKGNRGNTMITLYESKKLIDLIRIHNDNTELRVFNKGLSYDKGKFKIITIPECKKYEGRKEVINILPRLIKKYTERKAHEAHLQMYITQNLGLGNNKTLDSIFNVNRKNIEWLGNEVSCGVGMQRIDILFSKKESETKNILYPIELKAVPSYSDNTRQLTRYIDWIEQYYKPNMVSLIQPVLLCKKENELSNELKELFYKFNKRRGILPLIYIEYEIKGDNIFFEKVDY